MNMNDYDIDDRALDDALRTIDVADRQLDSSQQARKQALLFDILAASTGGSVGAPAAREAAGSVAAEGSGARRGASDSGLARSSDAAEVVPIEAGRARQARRGRRSGARWLIPAAAAAALVGAFALSGLPGDEPAYASWTPDPTPVSGEVLTRAEAACRQGMADSARHVDELPAELRPITRPEEMQTVVAERRGNYLFLAMAAENGSTQQCFFDADKPSRPHGMTGGAATASTPPPTVLAPGELEGSGGGASSGPEGVYEFAVGRVGSDVTGVTVTADGKDVRATVTNGYFAAWWPGKAREANGASPLIRYGVSLRDGTVREDLGSAPGEAPREAPGPREIGLVESGGGVSDKGSVATVAGHVGSEVVGVTLDVGGEKITAEVSDGTFYAEWPAPDSHEAREITYDLTLRDGTVLTGQQPSVGAAQ